MQPLDPSGVYSPPTVINTLAGKYGTRVMTYRFDRLDEFNNYLGPIDGLVTSASVSNNALADIKRTAKFRILDRGPINYLKDRIKPWAMLAMRDGGKIEWPLGVFLLTTPTRVLDADGQLARDVVAYDQLLALTQDKVSDRYSIAAGTLYTNAIATVASNFLSSIIPSALTIPAAIEWEPGTSKLRILNDLLGAINYESAWFDEVGILRCRPYFSPSTRAVEYDYSANSLSVISGNVEQTIDLFSVPNKWVLVKTEADQAPITGIYTNTSPTSPTSTVSRGRTIVDFRTETDAADQGTIDAKAARVAFETSQVFEEIKFMTIAMPMHSNADVLNVGIPGLAVADKYSERTWELPLKPGALMTHTVRRVVSI